MDNQEEDQELQEEEEEEGGSSSSKGIQEEPHQKSSSLTPPKVAKKVDPPPPFPIHEKSDADEKRDGREQFKSYIMDKYGLMPPFEKTRNRESPVDSDTNQENAKQFGLPRNSPVTSADSKTNEEKDKRELSDEKLVELKSAAVSRT